jgi:small-conductance mechanosensitive channel
VIISQLMQDLLARLPDFGRRAATALVIALVFEIVVRIVNRVIDRALRVAMLRPTDRDAMKRIRRRKTLTSVAQNAARWVLYFIAIIWILTVLGVERENLKTILASAALVGLAISFGAQKLVRDVITGFLLVAEDQFDVDDRVTIGAVTGTVEEMGIRVTRLRDDTGKVYFLANGDITQVCNHSRGPVQIAIDIVLPAGEDLERARAAVAAVGAQLAAENKDIAQPAQVEGVTAVSGGGVSLRVTMAAPAVRHEVLTMALREAIARRFAEEGIRLS